MAFVHRNRPPTSAGPLDPAVRAAQLLGGKTALGRVVKTPADIDALVREGLPPAAIEWFSANTGVTSTALSLVLSISSRTLSRNAARAGKGKKANPLTVGTSDRLLRLSKIVAQAETALGSLEAANRWLGKPSVGLGGAVPFELMVTEDGARQVSEQLIRIEHGMLA